MKKSIVNFYAEVTQPDNQMINPHMLRKGMVDSIKQSQKEVSIEHSTIDISTKQTEGKE